MAPQWRPGHYVVLVVLIVLVESSHYDDSGSWNLGCYRDSPHDRVLASNMGVWSEREVTIATCRFRCLDFGDFGYAAIFEGKYCLCGRSDPNSVNGSLPDRIHMVNTGNCTHKCAGDETETCGGMDFASVFETPKMVSVTNLTIELSNAENKSIDAYPREDCIIPGDCPHNLPLCSINADICQQFVSQTVIDLNISVATGVVEKMKVDFDDGTPTVEQDFTSLNDFDARHLVLHHTFSRPGTYSILADVQDDDLGWTSAFNVIQVSMLAQSPHVSCPLYVPTGLPFDCSAKAVGSEVVAILQFDDEIRGPFILGDSQIDVVGQVSADLQSDTSGLDRNLHLLVNRIFGFESLVTGWRINAKSTGNVKLQVLRRSCPSDTAYCYHRDACIDDILDCTNTTFDSGWTATCSGSNVFGLGQHACVDTSNNDVPLARGLPSGQEGFTWVSETAYTITAAGIQDIVISDPADYIHVYPGDIIAVYTSGSSVLHHTDFSVTRTRSTNDLSSWNARQSNGWVSTSTGSWVGYSKELQVEAYAARFMTMNVQKVYPGLVGWTNVTLHVSNLFSDTNETASLSVDSQVVIQDATFTTYWLEKTNHSHDFFINEHNGSRVVYEWDFGDGYAEQTLSQYTNHTYTSEGIYTVMLVSWNNISRFNYSFELTVQDLITNLTIEPFDYVSELGIPSQLFMNITQGTNVTYKVYVEDCFNQSFVLYHDRDVEPNGTVSAHNGYEAWVNFTFAEIGNYTVRVNVTNYVNWLDAEVVFPVGEAINNISVHQIPTLPYGNSTTLTLTLEAGTFTTFWLTLDGNITRDWFICDWTNAWVNWYQCGMPYFEGDLAPISNVTSNTTITNDTLTDAANFTGIESWKWDDTFDECQKTFGIGYVHFEPTDYMEVGNHTVDFVGWDLVTSANVSTNMTFLVSYIIENMVTVPNTTYVIPGDFVEFNMTLDQASHFDVLFDYGDTLFDTDYTTVMLQGDEMLFAHAWALAGNYTVNLTATNDVSEMSNDHLITVQNPVQNYTLVTASPFLIPLGGSGQAVFNVTFAGDASDLLPTDTFVEYLFGTPDNDTATWYLEAKRDESTYHHFLYDQWGNYSITLNISNLVSHGMLYTDIILDEEIHLYSLEADRYMINYTTVVTFTASILFGSRIDVTWDYGESSSDLEFHSEPRTISITHGYEDIGVFWPSLHGVNSIDEELVWIQNPIIVQHPVTGFTLLTSVDVDIVDHPDWSIDVRYDLVINQSAYYPTNATLEVDFGVYGLTAGPLDMEELWANRNTSLDGTGFTSDPSFHIWSQTITYTHGVRNLVSARIYNLVHEDTYTVTTDIYEDIVNYSCKAYSVAPGSPPDALLDGFGLEQNYFPMEHSIAFQISMSRGSHITYDWDWGDGQVEQVYDDDVGRHTYSEPGTYEMTMNLTNLLSSGSTTCTVHLQRSVGPTSLYAPTPISRNRTIEFKLYPGYVGTGACYAIDFKDPESEVNRYLYVGDMAECAKKYGFEMNLGIQRQYPKSVAEMEAYAASPGFFIVDNFFWTLGTFEIEMHAFNGVSENLSKLRLGVTRGPCQWPLVDISSVNQCDNVDRCTNFSALGLSGVKQHFKSLRLTIASNITINCSSTTIANFNWKIYKVDPSDNSSVLLEDETSTTKRQYLIPKHNLTYGLYMFRLNVSMDGEINIENVDWVYIEIIKTPLGGSIAGGAKRRKGWSTNVTFDALTDVVDPDDPNDPKTDYTCRWFCRRLCEKFAIYDPTYTTVITNYTHNCSDYVVDVDRGGCFLFDDIHEPGEFVPEFIEPNTGGCQMIMDTFNTYELSSIEVLAIVSKDTRQLVASQVMDITEGEPPELEIRCVPSTCPDRVNYATKTKYTSYVVGSRPGIQYVYQWQLSYAVITQNVDTVANFAPYYFDDDIRVDYSDEVFGIYGKPDLVSSAISINPGLFAAEDADHKIAYIYVKAYRARGSASNYGDNFMPFLINKPPVPGECHVEPPTGTALETLFHIECGEPFEDVHTPFKYEVRSSRFYLEPDDPAWEGNILYKANAHTLETQSKTGDQNNSYAMYYQLRCIDSIGSWTNMVLDFTVLPPPAGVLEEKLNSLDPADAATANPAQYAAFLLSVSELMFEMFPPTENCSVEPVVDDYDDGETDEDYVTAKQEYDLCKEEFADDLENYNSLIDRGTELVTTGLGQTPVQTFDDATSVMAGMGAATSNPDSMNEDTESIAASSVTNFVTMMSSEAGEGTISSEGTTSAVGQSFSVCGQTMEATSQSITASQEDAAGVPVDESSSDGVKRRRRRKKRSSQSACAASSDQLQDKIMEQGSMMGGLVANSLIPGEDPTPISSSTGAMLVDKQYADGGGGPSAAGGSQFEFPGGSDLVGEGNETSSTVQSTVIMAKTNPFVGKNATNNTMNVNSNVVSLKMVNDTGGALPLG